MQRVHRATATRSVASLLAAVVLAGCATAPRDGTAVPSEPAASPAAAAPTPPPAFGLTWALVQDVERPEEAFALPSDLATAPTGPGTAGHPGHFPGQAILRDVAVAGDRLVAVGYSATGEGTWTARAWTSTDAVHWRLSTIDGRAGSFAAAVTAARGGGFVAVGWSGTDAAAWTSPDGRTWAPAAVARVALGARAGEPERMTAVWTVGAGLVAGGSAGPELGDRQARFWRSPDGARWEPVADAAGFDGAEVSAIRDATDGSLVALGLLGTGQRTSSSVAWRSTDGARWERIDDPALATGLAVALASMASGFVAVGSDADEREAVAWISSDGRTWTRAPSEVSRLHFGDKIRMTDVLGTAAGTVGVGNFVGVQYGDATSWLSEDGRTWVRAPRQPALGQGEPEALAAWRDRLVIVGSRGAPDNYIPSVWVSPNLP